MVNKPLFTTVSYLNEPCKLASGDVEMQISKIRDRSGNCIKFNSNLIPPYLKRIKSLATLLLLLYLKGISTGDMLLALEPLLGKNAKGLSVNSTSRLNPHTLEKQCRSP